jgi:hypothetical protein
MNRSPLVHRLRSNAKIFVVMRAFNISMLDQARGAATLHLLERFRAKWTPVRVKKTRQKQESGLALRF